MIFLPYNNINTIPYKLKILVGQPSIFVGVYSLGTVHELSNTPSNGKIYLQTWGRPKARDWLATESNHQRIRQGKKCSANGARADTSFTSWIATNCKMAGIALMLGWEIRGERSIPLKDNQIAMLTIVRSVNLMCFWSVFSVKSEGKQGEGMPSNHYTIGCIQGSPLDLAISLLHLLRRRKCVLLVINRCRTLHAAACNIIFNYVYFK